MKRLSKEDYARYEAFATVRARHDGRSLNELIIQAAYEEGMRDRSAPPTATGEGATDLLSEIRALPTIRASEIDGEESDGTPRQWRSRPYVSLTMLERLLASRPALAQPAPADPMDWPLPCDVTVGHGTMRKGVALRTLVARMKALYEMATGNNADAVAAPAPAASEAVAVVTPEMIAAGLQAAHRLDPVLSTLYPNELTAVYQAMHAVRPIADADECTTCGAMVVGVAAPFDAAEARARGIEYFAERYPALREALDASPSTPEPAAASGAVAEPVKLLNFAVWDDGELRLLAGRKGPAFDCELYAMPDGGRAPLLYAAPTSGGESVDAARQVLHDILAEACQAEGESWLSAELYRRAHAALQTAPAQQGAGKDGAV